MGQVMVCAEGPTAASMVCVHMGQVLVCAEDPQLPVWCVRTQGQVLGVAQRWPCSCPNGFACVLCWGNSTYMLVHPAAGKGCKVCV